MGTSLAPKAPSYRKSACRALHAILTSTLETLCLVGVTFAFAMRGLSGVLVVEVCELLGRVYLFLCGANTKLNHGGGRETRDGARGSPCRGHDRGRYREEGGVEGGGQGRDGCRDRAGGEGRDRGDKIKKHESKELESHPPAADWAGVILCRNASISHLDLEDSGGPRQALGTGICAGAAGAGAGVGVDVGVDVGVGVVVVAGIEANAWEGRDVFAVTRDELLRRVMPWLEDLPAETTDGDSPPHAPHALHGGDGNRTWSHVHASPLWLAWAGGFPAKHGAERILTIRGDVDGSLDQVLVETSATRYVLRMQWLSFVYWLLAAGCWLLASAAASSLKPLVNKPLATLIALQP
ncbi:hypothetical protein JHW43_005569 [Diplocarpon mali]|nr:hypothetical protein JHW43_005569 [Diplocarpon mali]